MERKEVCEHMRNWIKKGMVSFLCGVHILTCISTGLFAAERNASITKEVLANHIVQGISPDDVQVNLFDYWVDKENPTAPQGDILTKESFKHYRQDPTKPRANFSGFDNWNRGINQDHLLIFGDGVVHAGLWNKGAGESTDYGKVYAGMEGIVKSTLIDGYPVINTDAARSKLVNDKDLRDWEKISEWKYAGEHDETATNYATYSEQGVQNLSESIISNWEEKTGQTLENGVESLSYLFDPNESNEYKKSYQNVKDLFQIDEKGYYYYNMRENFAEFQEKSSDPTQQDAETQSEEKSDGRFVLYDAPATVRTDNANSIGNFLPFNRGQEVFTSEQDGQLKSTINCFGNTMNHHLGMTVNVDFRQPINGSITQGAAGKQPMTFQFSGDDDVWIYIDDVLVLDLGGVHSELYGIIDFATGNVLIGRSFGTNGIPEYDSKNPDATANLVTKTTLRQLFKDAGKESSVQWLGNTFASNTDHTLNMFYLERGNYDSSLSMRFNLAPSLYQQIKKVDQDGNPMEDVEFTLYQAALGSDGLPVMEKEGSYQTVGEKLSILTTDENGMAQFTTLNTPIQKEEERGTPDNVPFDFADRYVKEGIKYYVLKESRTPPGYRSMPVDIVLEYKPDDTILVVYNRWATGAYASFTSTIQGSSNVTYGNFDVASGEIYPSDTVVDSYEQENGLVVAVPMLYKQETKKWEAMHGSNTEGFQTVTPIDRSALEWRKAALVAIVNQCAMENAPNWYLHWNSQTRRLEGSLSDLPGRADRYKINNPDGDMKMVYAIIRSSVFERLNIQANTDAERYAKLGEYIREQQAKGQTMEQIAYMLYSIPSNGQNFVEDGTYAQRGFSFMNVDQFIRNFRSLIYIPNEQRELRVWKVDQNGQAVNGATFALVRVSDDPSVDGTIVATGITSNVDGHDGVLVFKPNPPKTDDGTVQLGYAEVAWAREQNDQFYLQEISAPKGYQINNTKIPVVVGIYSIYADAGTKDDGVTVMAGVGKLTQTMVKYASDETVNITLRDITAYAQTQESDKFDLHGWQDLMLNGVDVERMMNLHYGKNALKSYGLHDKDGGQNFYPFFVSDTGFLRTRVKQNYEALISDVYGETNNSANKEKIDEDITGLFSLLNIVVVTDKNNNDTETGELVIGKTIAGENLKTEDYTHLFEFHIELTDENGNALTSPYYFYGTDKSGYVKHGDKILLHHDESITILGLPKGTQYKITETLEDGWYVLPNDTQQGIIEKEKTASAEFVNSRSKLVQLKGKKVWDDNSNKQRPDTITLYIKEGNTIVETLTLSAGEDHIWDEDELSFASSYLPAERDGQPITYYLTEETVKGYKSSVTQNGEYNFVITNTYLEDTPTPIDPENPTINPPKDIPDIPSKPSDENGKTPSKGVTTGDMMKVNLWTLGLLVSGSVTLFLVYRRRLKKRF